MKNAHGESCNGIGRTATIPREGEMIQLNLTPKEKCGRRIRLQINDPANMIEDVEIVRVTGNVVVPV